MNHITHGHPDNGVGHEPYLPSPVAPRVHEVVALDNPLGGVHTAHLVVARNDLGGGVLNIIITTLRLIHLMN